mgnify:CR=1 FL=1
MIITNTNKEQDAKIAEQTEALEAQQAEIEELKKKLADMEAEKAAMQASEVPSDSPKPKYTEAQLNEYVEVTLFKDGGRYSDDVIVSVNGETCQIQRGVKVKIKRKFALVLERSQAQNIKAAELMANEEKSFEDKMAQLN